MAGHLNQQLNETVTQCYSLMDILAFSLVMDILVFSLGFVGYFFLVFGVIRGIETYRAR